MPEIAKLRWSSIFAPDEAMMGTHAKPANGPGERRASADLGFLPAVLVGQCRSLIESYHDVHGFGCLPDVLWKSGLGPFIQKHAELGRYLRKASTTRSAKKSNSGFVEIATVILSLEILACSFAGWGAIYPDAAETAREMLRRTARRPPMPLMEFYLYPPRHMSSAAIATLVPPPLHQPTQPGLYDRTAKPELSGEKQALRHVNGPSKPATLPPSPA